MKKYLIIEDERFAYEEMKRMMASLRPDYELSGWASSVEQAVQLIKNVRADLMLVDIRLSDGDSFDIFEQVHSDIPVIFTTAYDEYALKAFKLHSIDYLLKPVNESDLEAALAKFERMSGITPTNPQFVSLRNEFERSRTKNRFLIQYGDNYEYIPTPEVAFFYSEEKYSYLHTFSGRRHIIDYSLDRLGSIIDPSLFFRVSRSCIVNINSVKRVTRYFTGRLKLHVKPDCPFDITVSRNRVKEFLSWMDDQNQH